MARFSERIATRRNGLGRLISQSTALRSQYVSRSKTGSGRRSSIAEAAHELDAPRSVWLNSPDASESELKKRTLTNRYNQRPTWLANLHAALDRAVWDAYGWANLDPATTSNKAILSRLLALNLERASSTTTCTPG